jgi:hypothetical protein
VLSDDILLNDYTLSIQDRSSFDNFSKNFKTNLKQIVPSFKNIFDTICCISQHHFYLRLLSGISRNQSYAEFLFSKFSNNFIIQLCLVRDKNNQDVPNSSIEKAQSLQKWFYKEDLSTTSEFEFYTESWYLTQENSMQECGLKYLRVLTDFFSEEDLLGEWATYIKNTLLTFINEILQNITNSNQNICIYFLNDSRIPRFDIINLLMYSESNMFQLIREEDFEDVVSQIMKLPLHILDLPLLRFVESYFNACYGNLTLREVGLQFAWKLFESNRHLLSYIGIRILLLILLKFKKSQILELNLDYTALFKKFELLLVELSGYSADCLSHFLDLINETVVALPFSPKILDIGLSFLESIWTQNLSLSGSEVFLKSCQMMVDFFVEADFAALHLTFCQRLAQYISQIVQYYDQTKEIVILENCFFPLICCFLFKIEKYIGKRLIRLSNPSTVS